MNPKEASKINSFLANLSGKNKPLEIFIDNLHSPYFEFQEDYILPSISTIDGVDFKSAQGYLQSLSEFIPELIQKSFILPEPRPKKENHKIFLVRNLSSQSTHLTQQFIWILSLDVGYLGGSSSANTVRAKVQGQSASVRTNRIYFQSRVIPVESLVRERNEIRGFDPYEIQELLKDLASGRNPESRIKPFSELFDDPDFTTQEDAIRTIYKIGSEVWQPGKIYYPMGIEYLSLGFRFLEDRFDAIRDVWNEISSSIWFSDASNKKSTNQLEPMHRYLKQFRSESSISPSGNIRWKISKNP